MGAVLARPLKIATLTVIQFIQRTTLSIKTSAYFSPATQPDIWRTLITDTSRKSALYQSHIFTPKRKNITTTAKNDGPLPLVITVHGGGFIMNNPSADDALARYLADEVGCLVASIDYRKLPRNPFPAAYEDVVESILALLSPSSTTPQVDLSKVVVLGSSAGGNLALAALQDPRLHHPPGPGGKSTSKIMGIVGFYPLVSMVPSWASQMATRPDPDVPDFLGKDASGWDMLLDLYAGVGTSPSPSSAAEEWEEKKNKVMGDVRISPGNFKKRSDLPGKVLMIGCEHDLLCHEAKVMTDKLRAGDRKAGRGEGNVTWTLVKGQTHGFDRFPKKGEEEERRVKDREVLYAEVAEWLKGVFA